MGAGQARQAWPAGQVSRKTRVLGGRREHLLGSLGRNAAGTLQPARMPTARTLTAKCEEGRGLGTGCPGEGQHRGPGGWPRGLGAGRAFLPQSSAWARSTFEAAQGGLWEEDSLPRAVGVGVRQHLPQSRARHSGSWGAFSAPLAWGPRLPWRQQGLSWLPPRSPRSPQVVQSLSVPPGSQEGPALPPQAKTTQGSASSSPSATPPP